MFTNLWNKIRNFGVSKAINALDLLQPAVEKKLEEFKAETAKMNSRQMSIFIIDQVQDALRKHFNIS